MERTKALWDTAQQLAALLKEEPVVVRFSEAKAALAEDEHGRALVESFNALQRRAQVESVTRGAVSEELAAKLGGLYAAIEQSDAAVEYLLAQSALHGLVGELYALLGTAAGVETGFLEE